MLCLLFLCGFGSPSLLCFAPIFLSMGPAPGVSMGLAPGVSVSLAVPRSVDRTEMSSPCSSFLHPKVGFPRRGT